MSKVFLVGSNVAKEHLVELVFPLMKGQTRNVWKGEFQPKHGTFVHDFFIFNEHFCYFSFLKCYAA